MEAEKFNSSSLISYDSRITSIQVMLLFPSSCDRTVSSSWTGLYHLFLDP